MQVEVSQEFREQSYSGESLYDARLTIDGNEIPTSQISKIKINSPIVDTSQETFYVGTFISQEITIVFKNLDGLDIQTGNEVYLEIGQLINEEYEYIPIGHFLVDDLSENYSSTCEIPCLDYATKFKPNVDYSPCFVDGKASVDTILEWMCEYFDVEIGDYPDINGDIEVSTYDSTVSGKQWVSYIAEIKGCNAKMGRDGKLYLIPLNQQPTTTIDALKSKSWALGEKYEISQVIYSDAIRNFTFGTDTENTLYIRQDNPFITGEEAEQVVENIYDEVNGFQVYSLKVENYGDVSLNCWDIVTYTLGEDEQQNPITYNTFYNNNLVYEMNVMVTNETKIPTKQQEVTTNVLGGDEKTRIKKLSTTVNGLTGQIVLLAEEVGEHDNRITTVEQDVNTIRQTAISYEDLKRSATSISMLHIEDAVANYPLKFSIKNASVLFPETSLYPSSNTIPEYQRLVLVVDKTQTLSDEAKIIELPVKNLYAKDDVYDEFVVEKNKAKLIHRLILQNGEVVPLQQEIIEDLPDVEIPMFDGDNYIYLYSLINDSAIYEITYTIPSEFTDVFATEVYVNSSIEQSANQILLQVNEKVDEDEIIAKLNVAVEEGQGIIELKGNSVIIESDNFKLDENGTIQSENGVFSNVTIDNDAVTLNRDGIQMGTGTSIVGGNGMLTQFHYGSKGKCGFTAGAFVNWRNAVYLDVFIPDNFTPKKAKLVITHNPGYVTTSTTNYRCYVRYGKIYYSTEKEPYEGGDSYSETAPSTAGTVVSTISGSNSGKTFSAYTTETVEVELNTNIFTEGNQFLYIADYTDSIPTDYTVAWQKTGFVSLDLFIEGYVNL